MGIRTRSRTFGQVPAGNSSAGSSFDTALKNSILGANIAPNSLSRAVFMPAEDYANTVGLLSRSGLTVEKDEQEEIANSLKEAIGSLTAFQDELNKYGALLGRIQRKRDKNSGYNPNAKEDTDKSVIESKIAALCDEYLDGSNAVEVVASKDCYDMEPILESYTDFDNLKTIVEDLDDEIKFGNAGLIRIIDAAAHKLGSNRDMLKRYLAASEKTLGSDAVRFTPTNEVGYYDKKDDRVYVNVERMMERLNVSSLSALLKLRDNNHVKQEFYKLVRETLQQAS